MLTVFVYVARKRLRTFAAPANPYGDSDSDSGSEDEAANHGNRVLLLQLLLT